MLATSNYVGVVFLVLVYTLLFLGHTTHCYDSLLMLAATHIIILPTGGDTRLQSGVFLLSVRMAVHWQV